MLAPRAGTAEPIARSGFRSGRDGDKDCSIILRNQQGSLTLPGERTLRQACLGLDRPSPVNLGSRATSIFVVAVRQETAFDLITHITKQATIAKCPSVRLTDEDVIDLDDQTSLMTARSYHLIKSELFAR